MTDQILAVDGKEKETGVLCGIFLGGFDDDTGLDQVLHIGRSLLLSLFHFQVH